MPINWNISSYTTLPSTQDKLREIIEYNPDINEGLVISAHNQTKGYGRYNRIWKEGEGNLYFSYLLKPKKDPCICSQLSLIVGISLFKTINNYIKSDLILKWPNDILIGSKKCAGILVEAIYNGQEYPTMIIGVGVNVKTAPMETSVCLNDYMNDLVIIDSFKARFLSIFDNNYQRWKKYGFKVFKSCFMNYTYPKGSNIGVNIDSNVITGEFIDIDEEGNLKLLCNKTQKLCKITSGDVFLI